MQQLQQIIQQSSTLQPVQPPPLSKGKARSNNRPNGSRSKKPMKKKANRMAKQAAGGETVSSSLELTLEHTKMVAEYRSEITRLEEMLKKAFELEKQKIQARINEMTTKRTNIFFEVLKQQHAELAQLVAQPEPTPQPPPPPKTRPPIRPMNQTELLIQPPSNHSQEKQQHHSPSAAALDLPFDEFSQVFDEMENRAIPSYHMETSHIQQSSSTQYAEMRPMQQPSQQQETGVYHQREQMSYVDAQGQLQQTTYYQYDSTGQQQPQIHQLQPQHMQNTQIQMLPEEQIVQMNDSSQILIEPSTSQVPMQQPQQIIQQSSTLQPVQPPPLSKGKARSNNRPNGSRSKKPPSQSANSVGAVLATANRMAKQAAGGETASSSAMASSLTFTLEQTQMVAEFDV
ncbi:unnamed protein product, partial [Mesorhabditis belari]|uniref:Uncharacterized protein n=1 Tax=Mesorhabditis belari TaxID=2138241 RepID=A0AAF3FG40_9BILA